MIKKIFCIHLGARAHYLIPRSLSLKDQLDGLITDTWIDSFLTRSILALLPFRLTKSLAHRFTSDIPTSKVYSFNVKFFLLELWIKISRKKNWDAILHRNNYFQKYALSIYKKYYRNSIVMGTSYTALKIFNEAKKSGQKIILYQIDPAVKEENIVYKLVKQFNHQYTSNWNIAPESYWIAWKEECTLADIIVVNSNWCKIALVEQGISSQKIKIIPLPYQLESKHSNHTKAYPAEYNEDRPLRCLFLGRLTLRKGIHIVLETALSLGDYPIEFILVGETEINIFSLNGKNVSYKGVATRSQTDEYYKHADIFIFPTFSDGFGLTQLEAMAWHVPVIASLCCGDVVIDGFNGIVLKECTVANLCKALIFCLNNPDIPKKMSSNCFNTVNNLI